MLYQLWPSFWITYLWIRISCGQVVDKLAYLKPLHWEKDVGRLFSKADVVTCAWLIHFPWEDSQEPFIP